MCRTFSNCEAYPINCKARVEFAITYHSLNQFKFLFCIRILKSTFNCRTAILQVNTKFKFSETVEQSIESNLILRCVNDWVKKVNSLRAIGVKIKFRRKISAIFFATWRRVGVVLDSTLITIAKCFASFGVNIISFHPKFGKYNFFSCEVEVCCVCIDNWL